VNDQAILVVPGKQHIWITEDGTQRPHSSLADSTPEEHYFAHLAPREVAE
jgi:hypothetical protein